MQRILIDGFPFIMIDESQDTNSALIDALFSLQRAHQTDVGLGLFGDMMQRIYADGKQGLGETLPDDWSQPKKRLNWRCPGRVIRLINKVRGTVDTQVQEAWSSAMEGHARLFIVPANAADKPATEAAVASRMATLTEDEQWTAAEGYRSLILEHLMAARRLNFSEMFVTLSSVDQFRTGLLNGSLSVITLFSNKVLPLIAANGDKFAIANIVRSSSPLLSVATLREAEDQAKAVKAASDAVTSLTGIFQDNASPTFGDVLCNVSETGLFEIPESLKPASHRCNLRFDEDEDVESNSVDEQSPREKAIDEFLKTPFEQIKPYVKYIIGASGFATHQGVKGLEFPRVMVIMDDSEARGFMFKYEKLFGGTERADAVVDATRRLFYVTCSRAERSLALVAYTETPDRVKQHVLENGWFEENEIQIGV